ncbi:PD-(D/E)XK nuclease family protein [Salinithrix halophila]|uniref:PD-(D/E)XK nuclease family protein n=1 Tax=Salinithrix halophila TaxID=1485204 RepID=A0ABV8JEN9_9BACL
MSGWVIVHPPEQAVRGIALSSVDPRDSCRTVCLVPGAQSIKEYRRILHHAGLDETGFFFQTFDSFVRGLLPPDPLRLMTPVEQEWLVRQATAEALGEEGGYFGNMKERYSWLKTVEARIGELKRAGVRPTRLSSLWADKGEGLEEFSRIFHAYGRLLKENRLLDHEEAYFLAMEAIRKGKAKLPARVVAEHFPDLSFLQEQLLVQLVTAGVPVTFHLAWDESRPRLFRETARLSERLIERGFGFRKVEPIPDRSSAGGNVFLHLTREVFSLSPRPADAENQVEVLAAPGVSMEAALTVARLKRWLEESEAPLSEAVLITNQPEVYHPFLFRELEEAGIPCSRPHTRPLKEHPLLQAILTALFLAEGREDLRPVLLENPVLPWTKGMERGVSWPKIWHRLGAPREAKTLTDRLENLSEEEMKAEGTDRETLMQLVELFHWVEEIPERQPWMNWVAWFESWVDHLDDSALRVAMARDRELLPLAVEEWKAWEELKSILAEWREIFGQADLGRQMCDRASFATALEEAANRKQVERKPGRRGGVRLLEPNQVRGDRYGAVFLLGCVEGEWPRSIPEDWLVSDQERERLRSEGVRLALSAEQREHQVFPFFQCVCAAKEKLVLSYPAMDEEGRRQLPSPYLEEVQRVFRKGSVQDYKPSIADTLPLPWEGCTSLSKGMERVVSVLGKAKSESVEEEVLTSALPLLGDVREKDPVFLRDLGQKIRVERTRWGSGWSSFDGVLTPSLPKEFAVSLTERTWSATQLNELARCRFHFFAGRLLKVLPQEDAVEGFSAPERGELMHRILCRFWDRYRDSPLTSFPREEVEEHLLATAETIFDEFARAAEGRDPFSVRIEENRLKGRLLSILEHEYSWRGKEESSDFRPRYLELVFGMGRDESLVDRREIDPSTREHPAELTFAEGRRIRLRGKVDRLDTDEEGFYVLYDYKSGSAPDRAEVKAGAHLQLPLYLWVLQEEFGLDPDKAVGAAFYTAGSRRVGQGPTNNRNEGLWRREEAQRAGISKRISGLLDEENWDRVLGEIRHQVTEQLERATVGDFAVDPTWDCPVYCPHRGVCRIDTRRVARKKGMDRRDG